MAWIRKCFQTNTMYPSVSYIILVIAFIVGVVLLFILRFGFIYLQSIGENTKLRDRELQLVQLHHDAKKHIGAIEIERKPYDLQSFRNDQQYIAALKEQLALINRDFFGPDKFQEITSEIEKQIISIFQLSYFITYQDIPTFITKKRTEVFKKGMNDYYYQILQYRIEKWDPRLKDLIIKTIKEIAILFVVVIVASLLFFYMAKFLQSILKVTIPTWSLSIISISFIFILILLDRPRIAQSFVGFIHKSQGGPLEILDQPIIITWLKLGCITIMFILVHFYFIFPSFLANSLFVPRERGHLAKKIVRMFKPKW